MPSSDPRRRLHDIVEAIDLIRRSVGSLSRDELLADLDKYHATERRLAIISEAAVKLGMLAEDLAPDQPWNDIRGLGNWLRHDYPNVLQQTIWEIVVEQLDPLRASCVAAIAEFDRRRPPDA